MNGYVIARPLKKIFEQDQLYNDFVPINKKYRIVEKLDGALGILFFYQNKFIFCSRQSFKSKQAVRASKIFYQKYCLEQSELNKQYTYIFEIIYPDNRFVINYGDREDIFLLAAVENLSGITKTVSSRFLQPEYLKSIDLLSKKKEGVVLQYEGGFNIKVKFEDYKRSYLYLAEMKRRILKEQMFLEKKSTVTNNIKCDFSTLFHVYCSRYLNLYIKAYIMTKNMSDEVIFALLEKKDVFPG